MLHHHPGKLIFSFLCFSFYGFQLVFQNQSGWKAGPNTTQGFRNFPVLPEPPSLGFSFYFHLIFDPAGIMVGVVLAVLGVLASLEFKEIYRPLLKAKSTEKGAAQAVVG